jgi:hypothetical protein
MAENITGGFVTADREQSNPKSIIGIADATCHVVKYVDGNSKEQVRIVFHAKTEKGDAVYILSEKIENSPVAAGALEWFSKAFLQRVAERSSGNGAGDI